MTGAAVELYRLLRRFEKGPVEVDGVPWPRTPEGAALKAYLCPAGKWTIAFGCTKHRDGSPVREGDTITPDQVYPYTAAAVDRVSADIKRIVKRPLNGHQTAAIADFVFNLGGEQLRTSPRLLPAIEEGRWEDAADIMGDYYRAWGKKNGKWHRMAMYGLRIRRFAAGCVLLGLDWEEACNEENIAFPKKLEWQEGWSDGERTGGRYFDVVLPEATAFAAIHRLAAEHPLSPATQPAPEAKPAPAAIPDSARPASKNTPASPVVPADMAGQPEPATQPAPAAPAPKPAATVSGPVAGPAVEPKAAPSVSPPTHPGSAPVPKVTFPKDEPKVAPAPAPIGTKPPSPNSVQPEHVPYRIDPSAGLKPMEETERFVGAALMFAGTFIRSGMANGMKVSGVGGIIAVGFLDLMKSPTNLAVTISVVAIGVTAIGWSIGVILDKTGLRKKKRGEQSATQAMY